MKPETTSTLWYIAFGVVVVLIGALAGLYAYLYSRNKDTAETDAARGLQSPIPSFSGGPDSTASNVGGTSGTSTATSTVQEPNRLWQVTQGAVAGMAFISQSSTTDLVYADRATGYVYEANVQTGLVTRLTDTLEPKTQRAIFPGDGEVVMESENGAHIQTIAASFSTLESATDTLPQPLSVHDTSFPVNLRSIAATPTGLWYVAGSGSSGGGWTSNWDGSSAKQVFSSSIADWQPLFGAGETIVLENPADDLSGYAYAIDSKGGQKLLIGPYPGLMLLPNPSQQAFLFSTSAGGQLMLSAQTGTSAPTTLPIHTFAEKCAWETPSLFAYCAVPQSLSSHPINDWYQGTLHTTDTFWQVDASKGSVQTFYTPQVPLDVADPILDPSDSYLAFLNNTDQTLWVLRIAQ